MEHLTAQVRIVLVRPSSAGNVGAVARAMANFAMTDLRLVQPRCDVLARDALRRSTRGEAILRAARVVDTLEAALADAVFTAGASCRGGRYRDQITLMPRQMAASVCERLRGTNAAAALVFGPEDSGLRGDEILACDAVVRIPANPAYESLNLSHAVTVCAYELFRAASSANGTLHESDAILCAGEPEPADSATVAQLMTKLERALLRIGYLRPEHPEHLLHAIRAVLGRARLTQTEAQILIGLAQQIQSFADAAAAPQTHEES
jgi:tRNA/rRNA methyltransferase